MGRDTYTDVPLREASLKKVISQDASGENYEEHRDGPHETVWLKTAVTKAPRLQNDWLVWSFSECLSEAHRLDIAALDAFAVELIDRSNDDGHAYTHSDSLGYFYVSGPA
jgi:hypothetical protein